MVVERAGNNFSLQDGTGRVIVKVAMCLHRLQSRISVPITQILRVGNIMGSCNCREENVFQVSTVGDVKKTSGREGLR